MDDEFLVLRAAAAAALIALVVGPAAAAQTTPVSPYLELSDGGTAQLADELPGAGLHAVTLAFIVSGRRPCSARWDGGGELRSRPFAATIATLMSSGIEPTLSFGGQVGRDLGLTCRTSRALASVYRKTAAAYGITSLDFDLEGTGLKAGALARRARAMRMLQRANPRIRISLTLPVATYGLLPDALRAIRATLAAGVRIDSVNIMTMDFGDEDAPNPAGHMGAYSIGAAKATHEQLARLGHGLGAWSALAVTPMLGINDVASEVFGLSDAAELATFAGAQGVGQIHYWVFNRDRPCEQPSPETQNECSGVDQAPWAFAQALSG